MTKEEAKQFGLSLLQGIADRNTDEYAENVRFAIEALSKPSLPSNLDEAARKAGKEVFAVVPGELLNENGRYCMTNDKNWPLRKHYIRGFKAGAEWMAGQMMNTNLETK